MNKQHLIKLINHDCEFRGQAKITERALAEALPEKFIHHDDGHTQLVRHSTDELERIISDIALKNGLLYTRDADVFTFVKKPVR